MAESIDQNVAKDVNFRHSHILWTRNSGSLWQAATESCSRAVLDPNRSIYWTSLAVQPSKFDRRMSCSTCEKDFSQISSFLLSPLFLTMETTPGLVRAQTEVGRVGLKSSKVFKFRRKSIFTDVFLCFVVVATFLPSAVVSSEDRESDTKLQNSFHNSKLSNRTSNDPSSTWLSSSSSSSSSSPTLNASSTTTTSTTVAPSKSCRPPCSNGVCDTSTGSCVCYPGWRGDQCDLCGGKVK